MFAHENCVAAVFVVAEAKAILFKAMFFIEVDGWAIAVADL